VLAVATGIADGMDLGLNARAGLITRGMNEMLRLGVALGARPETLIGLSGLGDLVLTCTGDLSRNRRLGLALGQGVAIDEAVRRIGQVVESILTADEVARLAAKHGLDLPISAGVRAVLHGEVTPVDGLKALMAREQKPEYRHGLKRGRRRGFTRRRAQQQPHPTPALLSSGIWSSPRNACGCSNRTRSNAPPACRSATTKPCRWPGGGCWPRPGLPWSRTMACSVSSWS